MIENGVVLRFEGQEPEPSRSLLKARESSFSIEALDGALSLLNGLDVCDVAIGHNHFLALTSDGKVYSFGDNHYGQLGLGHVRTVAEPTLISKLASRLVSCIMLYDWPFIHPLLLH